MYDEYTITYTSIYYRNTNKPIRLLFLNIFYKIIDNNLSFHGEVLKLHRFKYHYLQGCAN